LDRGIEVFSWFPELPPTSQKIRSKSCCCQKIHLICIFYYSDRLQNIACCLLFVSNMDYYVSGGQLNWSSYVTTRLWYHCNRIIEISGWLLGDLQVIWEVTYITKFEVRLYKACFLVIFILTSLGGGGNLELFLLGEKYPKLPLTEKCFWFLILKCIQGVWNACSSVGQSAKVWSEGEKNLWQGE
jgi:hypothetical protein